MKTFLTDSRPGHTYSSYVLKILVKRILNDLRKLNKEQVGEKEIVTLTL